MFWLIKEEDKSHFRLNDDPIGNGYDFIMNVEKVTIQVDSFISE